MDKLFWRDSLVLTFYDSKDRLGDTSLNRHRTARLWRVVDGTSVGAPLQHKGGFNGAMFDRDGGLVLTWSFDAAQLWRTADGTPVGPPLPQEGGIYRAMFNPDGSRVLTLSHANNIARLWRAVDGTLVGPPLIHEATVRKDILRGIVRYGMLRGATFNRDGSLVLTQSTDDTAWLWRATDGTPVGTPLRHDDWIKGATFNRDESLVLTWSDDGTARLWRAADGTPVGGPLKHEGHVLGATFNRDESLVLTWSTGGIVRLWDIHADYDFPKLYLSLLVEVMTGTTMDDMGNIHALSPEEWKKRQRTYIRVAEEHLKKCLYQDTNLYVRQKKF